MIPQSTVQDIMNVIVVSSLEEEKLSAMSLTLKNLVYDSFLFQCNDASLKEGGEILLRHATAPIPELDDRTLFCKIGTGKSWYDAELNAS